MVVVAVELVPQRVNRRRSFSTLMLTLGDIASQFTRYSFRSPRTDGSSDDSWKAYLSRNDENEAGLEVSSTYRYRT